MGNKTVFNRAASERKDLEVIQVLIEIEPGFSAPIGLEMEVRVSMPAQIHDEANERIRP
jgi:HlyD family secretion protein